MTKEEREKAIEVFENANKCLEQRKKFECDYNCDKCTASKAYSQKELEKPVNTALEALKQEPCEDAVSRADANKLVDELARAIDDKNRHYPKRGRDIAIIARDIERLPSVTPTQKMGEWKTNSDFPDRLICSCCANHYDMWKWESKRMHFCPNCGAKMKGAD